MNTAEITELFTSINCARQGSGYAPHKPILILLLFEKILNGHINDFQFSELDHDLKRLLEKYGSPNASNTRNEPFWRLKNDGLVDIAAPSDLLGIANTPSPNLLTENKVSIRFRDDIYQEIRYNADLIQQIATSILEKFVVAPYRTPMLADCAPTIKRLNRSYWWVSQNQTYQHEVPGNFMWSPKTNRNGGSNPSYNFMTQMKVGDIVFSFANTYIKAIGIVTNEATPSIKPNFGLAGANWLDDGWLVEVSFEELNQASFKPGEHMDTLTPLLPEIYSPIRPNGVGNQIYLAKIPAVMADALFKIAGDAARAIEHDLSSDIKYDIPTDETEVETEVQMRTDIGPTQKTQIINSRRGQGVFKANVRLIETACRVTGVNNPRHLIASHIKPWSKSDDTEKLSGFNGLLLSPHIDHLFDKGLISFENSGKLILSKQFDQTVLDKWSIDKSMNVGSFRPEQIEFLDFHRDVVLN